MRVTKKELKNRGSCFGKLQSALQIYILSGTGKGLSSNWSNTAEKGLLVLPFNLR